VKWVSLFFVFIGCSGKKNGEAGFSYLFGCPSNERNAEHADHTRPRQKNRLTYPVAPA
jgi:hypothetical protein